MMATTKFANSLAFLYFFHSLDMIWPELYEVLYEYLVNYVQCSDLSIA